VCLKSSPILLTNCCVILQLHTPYFSFFTHFLYPNMQLLSR
jgi:hypothetical protein